MNVICYIISDVNKALAFEWHANKLRERDCKLHFILINNNVSVFELYLLKNGFSVTRISYKNKWNLFSSILKCIKTLKKYKVKVISVHLLNAGIIGLTAGFLCGIKKRIYTRHHSTYHHEYAPKGIKIDKFINFLSTDIIAISENVKNILINKEGVNPNKIHLIHHGFLLDDFCNVDKQRVDVLMDKYNVNCKDEIVVGIVSRYFKLKGIEYTIKAFHKFLYAYPNSKLVLCGAFGSDLDYIKNCLLLIPSDKYIEIEFEEDNFALYKLFHIFIHVPDNINCEAFGQIYIEALASGTPSIFTLSGVATEFIIDNYNAVVVDYKNSEEIYIAMCKLIEDIELKNKLIKNGFESIQKDFQLDNMINKLINLYK
jgi:glycosyltransferase involved in cell wall biosynthesis